MVIYLFRDESGSDVFAFTTELLEKTFCQLHPVRNEPSLRHLRASKSLSRGTLMIAKMSSITSTHSAIFLFEGQLLEPCRPTQHRRSSPEC